MIVNMYKRYKWLPLLAVIRLIYLVAGPAYSQQSTTLSMSTPAPAPVPSGSATWTGTNNTGRVQIFYWIIARTLAGATTPTGPFVANGTLGAQNLSSSQTVLIQWAGLGYATGYDVVRSTTGSYPAPCVNCAIAINQTATTITDTGVTGSAYPGNVNSAQNVSSVMSIDNVTDAAPFINVQLFNSQFRLALTAAGTSLVTINTTASVGLPVIGAGGTVLGLGTRSGNTTRYVTTTGSTATNDCAKFDANGNVVSNGSSCGGGGGGGDVVGPASAVSGNAVGFNGVTGKLILDSGKVFPGGVIVGTTDTQTLTNKVLTTPTIASFVNATHDHSNTAGGGTTLNSPTIVTPNISATGWTNAVHAHAANNSGGQLSTSAILAANLNGNGTKLQLFTGSAPATNDCAKFDINGNIVTAGAACGSGSGGGVLYGALASLPAAGTSGRLYLPNNSVFTAIYDNGATWDYLIGGIKAVPTTAAAFSTSINPGSSTWTDQQSGSVLLNAVTASGGSDLHLRLRTIPVAPYTAEFCFSPFVQTTNYAAAGVAIRESSSGKIETASVLYSGGTQVGGGLDNWNSATSYNSTPSSTIWTASMSMVCIRLQDNSTNRVWSISFGGNNYAQLFSESNTAFITPDQIGVFVNSNGSSLPPQVFLHSYRTF